MAATAVRRRLSREESRTQTRERLLRAAARVFLRRGFHRASVEEVAETAGFSTGAVYSNFSGKEELLLALWDEREREEEEAVVEILGREPTFSGRIDAVGEWFARFIELDRERAQLQSEVFTVALRDRRLRAKLVERLRRPRSLLGAFIEAQCRELGIELPVPREQAATLVLALAGGLAQQKLVDPDSVPEELFPLALTLLVRGLAA
jgi:AcrR family transcriptional regulator